jgi:hypothetical protein
MRVIRAVHLALLSSVLLAATLLAASYKFTSTYTNTTAGPLDFSGKKVATLVITDDLSLRMSAEEALAREITTRGAMASASYRFIPKEELEDKDKAREWFFRGGYEGVVTLRLVDVTKEQRYSAVVWISGNPYYNNFWDYYGNGWATVVPLGSPKADTTLAVETVIYTIKDGKLIWAGISETTNPKDVASYVKGLVKAVGDELRKAKLVKK